MTTTPQRLAIWLSGGSGRSKLNLPTSITRRWKKDTEPMEERAAKKTLREMQPGEPASAGAR
jgi:hypothetical protein